MESNTSRAYILLCSVEQQIYDSLGNPRHIYNIEQYEKNADDKWILRETFPTEFVLNGKIYFSCNEHLIPLNMDFDSPTCGACYRISGEKTGYIKITSNTTLFSSELGIPGTYTLLYRFCRQDYSDGSCFYTLKDPNGNFRSEYGARNPSEIISALTREASAIRKQGEDFTLYDEMIFKIKSSIEAI